MSTPNNSSLPKSWSSSSQIQSYNELKGPPLAWRGIRHRLSEQDPPFETPVMNNTTPAHEMSQRDVGMYAWVKPTSKDPSKSTISIMKSYTDMTRACSDKPINCRTAPDPSVSVIQHHLQRARQTAGSNSYVTVFYCGHGIQEPPTEAGELWCYDKSFDDCISKGIGPSEYIPILLFDYLTWAGASTCYIWDAHYSGRFIKAARAEAAEIDSQLHAAGLKSPSIAKLHPPVYSARQIHFAACGPNELLPRVPGLPTDIFTSCLISPFRMCLLYHNCQIFPLTSSGGGSYKPRTEGYMSILLEQISDSLMNRLSSELRAILHTIAWQILEGKVYQQLFGQPHDLIATISGGYIVAQRILTTYNTHPESIPFIPNVPNHPLWTTWDLILDNFFEQLPPYAQDADGRWEKGLELVSFMSDQLESILTSDQSLLATQSWESLPAGLSRLPIICQAAMSDEFRVRACAALDLCLQSLDVSGLARALQGGVIEVSCRLLALGDEEIANLMISIWASLIRHDACTTSLVEREEGKSLCQLPGIQFFLGKLEHHLENSSRIASSSSSTSGTPKDGVRLNCACVGEEHDKNRCRLIVDSLVIQTTVVLASVASHSSTDDDYQFALYALRSASTMLRREQSLIQQWGALLIAQVVGSYPILTTTSNTKAHTATHVRTDTAMSPTSFYRTAKDLVSVLRTQLLGLVLSTSVETRATAVYALIRWIPRSPVISLVEMKTTLDLARSLLHEVQADASPLVRKQLGNFFKHVLECAGSWTTFGFWLHTLSSVLLGLPQSEIQSQAKQVVDSLKSQLEMTVEDIECLGHLMCCINVFLELRMDPDPSVSHSVGQSIKIHVAALSSHVPPSHWAEISAAASSTMVLPDIKWTEGHLGAIYAAGKSIAKRLIAERTEPPHSTTLVSVLNSDLFASNKLALQAYLAREASPGITIADPFKHPIEQPAEDKTWLLRQRQLEDSLVLAERQGINQIPIKKSDKLTNVISSVGLPWKWRMLDIFCPDPWSTITCHSFLNTVLSVNNSHELLLWDWSSSRKTGSAHLDMHSKARIHSARFVNELHEQTVMLAETSMGDIHVLSGPPAEPTKIRPISSFRALDVSRHPLGGIRNIVTTWWRQSGKLCVGGAADVINAWDCPAERRVSLLRTKTDKACVSVLYTEPRAGNVILAGLSNGLIKVFDLRHPARSALLEYRADTPGANLTLGSNVGIGSGLSGSKSSVSDSMAGLKLNSGVGSLVVPSGESEVLCAAVMLGESRYITSACANGLVSVHDLRDLSKPVTSIFAHPDGMVSAAFQPHSGLMSTLSNLHPPNRPLPATTTVNTINQLPPHPDPRATWTLYRSYHGTINRVSSDEFHFGDQAGDVWENGFKPYTYTHPLRPFLAVGFGRTCFLRGSGVGKGADTDSGSYVFLTSQAKYIGQDLDGVEVSV